MADSKLSLFTMMELGYRKIDRIKRKVILLAGNVKAGKSCVFNWAAGNQMVGEETNKGVKYVNAQMEDRSAAQIGQDTTPTTLVPNSCNIDDETTLLDMPGYNKANKYNEVIGAAYFLKTVFEKAEEFKFLIVIGEEAFFDTTGKSLVQTFQGFLGMFSLAALTAEIKERLFSSISVVITRAKQPQKHVAYLNLILQRIKDPKFKVQNRELIMELVGHMISDNRVGAFELARINSDAGRCNILNRFNEAGWQFIKVRQIKQEIGQSIVNISLKLEFKRLPQEEEILICQIMQNRIYHLTEYGAIFRKLKDTFKQNWKRILQYRSIEALPEQLVGQLNQTQYLDSFFQHIIDFLKGTDIYSSLQQSGNVGQLSYCPNLSQGIKSIMKIYELFLSSGLQYLSYNNLQIDFFSRITDCIKPFCRSHIETKIVQRLKYIIVRGFREFSSLYQICPSIISRLFQNMRDNCNSQMLYESSIQYSYDFLRQMPAGLLPKIFTSTSQIDMYCEILNSWKERNEEQFLWRKQNKISLQQIRQIQKQESLKKMQFGDYLINVELAKADIYIKEGKKMKACKMFVAILQIIQTQCSLLVGLQSCYMMQQRLNHFYLIKLRVVEKLVNILATLNNKTYPTAKQLAISISEYFKEIDAVCQLYDSLLLQSSVKDKLSSIYQQYADYCIKWGRYAQAKVLLQKKLRLQKDNFEERIATINSVCALIDDEWYLREDEKKRNARLKTRPPQNDGTLQSLLQAILDIINKIPEQSSHQAQNYIEHKKSSKEDDNKFVQQYRRMYLDEEAETHRPLIDKIEHIKLELALPDYEHFFNSSRAALKQSLQQQISSFSKYEQSQSLKLPPLRQTGGFNDFSKQEFVQTFGKPYLSLFYRTAKMKIRTVKELVFMHIQDTNAESIDQLESRVSQGIDELQRMVEQLEHSFIHAWKNSDFDRPDK